MQLEIIDLPEPQNGHSRKARRHPIHQTATDVAEVRSHRMARRDGVRFCELCDFLFAADVGEGVAFEQEVGGEHGAGDLSVVGAVADELFGGEEG